MNWFCDHYDGPARHKRLILIGRHERGLEVKSGRPPLAIDPKSLEVSIFPGVIDPRGSATYWPRYSVDGRLLSVSRNGFVDLYSRPPTSQNPEGWNHTVLIKPEEPAEPQRCQVIVRDDFLYIPGTHWHRINRQSWQAERLTSAPIASHDRFEHYSVSAHYGLVAWNRGDVLYQVTIDEANQVDESESYPFVPASVREQHARAVQAIQELGGSVGTEWGDCRHRARQANFRWRTVVYLPEEWNGADKDLDHLKGLYNLGDLYLVGADITDEGLKIIGQLSTLETLCLVETKATDKGLAFLKPLTKLAYCRLEGTAGGKEFTDAGLASIRQLPLLERLTLYGPGFTDKGLEHLKAHPRFRQLLVFDTATTKPGLVNLKNSRFSSFRFDENVTHWVNND